MGVALRPYQAETIPKLRNLFKQGKRRIALVAPTGSGKTIIASKLVELSNQVNNKNVLFIAHRREIIDQTAKKFDQIDLKYGVMMGDDGRRDANASIQIASIQTLIRRELPPADFIIVDECHLSLSDSFQKVLNAYNVPILGLTATPWRTDGKGLGTFYDDLVLVAQPLDLVKQGYLLNPEFYSPFRPDLSKVRVRSGDYREEDLALAMDKTHLVGSITEHWQRFAQGMCTVVFATSRNHSQHIVDEFTKIGVSARHIDHETPRSERDSVLADLASGKLQVVSNVGLLTEGWDLPSLQCVVLARPTMSLSLYMQMVGRVMRPNQGKNRALVMDHAGCLFMHNSPIAYRNYDLNDTNKSIKKNVLTNKIKTCPECFRVCKVDTANCKTCNHMFSKPLPFHAAGELRLRFKHLPMCKECGCQALERYTTGYASNCGVEYRCGVCGRPDVLATATARDLTRDQRHAEFYNLRAYAAVKGYKDGWAIYRYREIFGVTPKKDGF